MGKNDLATVGLSERRLKRATPIASLKAPQRYTLRFKEWFPSLPKLAIVPPPVISNNLDASASIGRRRTQFPRLLLRI